MVPNAAFFFFSTATCRTLWFVVALLVQSSRTTTWWLFVDAAAVTAETTLCFNACENAQVEAARTFQRCFAEAASLNNSKHLPKAEKIRCKLRFNEKLSEGLLQNDCHAEETTSTTTSSSESSLALPYEKLPMKIARTCVKENYHARQCDFALQRFLCDTNDNNNKKNRNSAKCCELRKKPGQYGNPNCWTGEPGCCALDGTWQCPMEDAETASTLFLCGGVSIRTERLSGRPCSSASSTTATTIDTVVALAAPASPLPRGQASSGHNTNTVITATMTPTSSMAPCNFDKDAFSSQDGFRNSMVKTCASTFSVTGSLQGTMRGEIQRTARVNVDGQQEERLGGVLLFTGTIADNDGALTSFQDSTNNTTRYLKLWISARRGPSLTDPFLGQITVRSSVALEPELQPLLYGSGTMQAPATLFSSTTKESMALSFSMTPPKTSAPFLQATLEPTSADDTTFYYVPVAPRNGKGTYPTKSLFIFRPTIKNCDFVKTVILNKIIVTLALNDDDDDNDATTTTRTLSVTLLDGAVSLAPREINDQLVVDSKQNVVLNTTRTPSFVKIRWELDNGKVLLESFYAVQPYHRPEAFQIPVRFQYLMGNDVGSEVWTTATTASTEEDEDDGQMTLVDEERFGYIWEVVRYRGAEMGRSGSGNDDDANHTLSAIWTNRLFDMMDGTLQDGSVNEHYRAWGQPVYAMAPGQIVKCVDGLPDNVPGKPPHPLPKKRRHRYGNHVVVRHANEFYVYYAHLQKGSVDGNACRIGKAVSPTQSHSSSPLGALGNSGASLRPHLLVFAVGGNNDDTSFRARQKHPQCNDHQLHQCHLRPLPLVGVGSIDRNLLVNPFNPLPTAQPGGTSTFALLNGTCPPENNIMGPLSWSASRQRH